MRAAVMRTFGPPEVLSVEEVPDPRPGPGQVVLEVEVAGLTFVETQLRSGHAPDPGMLSELPLIPGNGVGGRVAAVGPGSHPELIGRRVIATTGGRGGYAERVAVAAEQLIDVPDAVPLTDAVALLADGRTALALVAQADVQHGDTVLVEAAAGGVGSCLVQLAAARGATVVGCAGGARKRELVERLPAHVAVDYREPDWVERVRERVGGVDVAFDGVGGAIGLAALGLVRSGGRFCLYGMASGGFTRVPESTDVEVLTLRGAGLTAERMRELSMKALAEAAAGRLRPVIGQVFDLAQVAEAHAAIEARRTLGKTLLRMKPDGDR